LKIHVAVDIQIQKKKIVSLDVTSEDVHDSSRMIGLVENALQKNKVKEVITDSAYDSKENFQYLYDNNIETDIKVRKNSSCGSKGDSCNSRSIVTLKQLKNFRKWKHDVNYGYR
jgi:hypothetical protein